MAIDTSEATAIDALGLQKIDRNRLSRIIQ
jgi:hypothetical protein